MPNIPFTLTNENITVIIDGKSITVHAGTPQFHGLRDALFREDWDAVRKHVSRTGAMQQWLGDKFVIDSSRLRNGNEIITHKGVELPEAIQNRIWAMVVAGESPGPLFNFYERLHRNPSYRSRTQLFEFMQHAGIPIEPDGTFLAYKGVRHDYKDAHSGTVDNSPGAICEMPRNMISDDPDVACDVGYHVGALGYAGNFSERVVITRVDPEHVVSVPKDHNAKKMRVCKYVVIGNYGADNDVTMPSTTYTPDVTTETAHDPVADDEWGGDPEDLDEVEPDLRNNQAQSADAIVEQLDRAKVWKPVVLTSKPTRPKAAKFNRLNPKQLMEQSIDDLRKYASAHLKIVGASKMSGGKSALVSRILKVRRRRRS